MAPSTPVAPTRSRTLGVANPVYISFLLALGIIASLIVATVLGIRAFGRLFRPA